MTIFEFRQMRRNDRSGFLGPRISKPKYLAGRIVLGCASLALTTLCSLVFASTGQAQELVSASSDVSLAPAVGVVAADHDVVVDNQLGIVVLENLGPIPLAADVIALGHDVNGDRFVAFDTTTELSGGVIARPGDVVRYDGLAYSIEFDASAAGLPSGVRTDATSLSSVGLLLSFDTTVDLGGGLVAADEDLLRWDGSNFGLVLDSSTVGVDSAMDVDGAQDLGGGSFLVSFDTTGQVGGLPFDDEDVLRFDGAVWSLEFDASAAFPNWGPADIDAILVPEPGFGLMAGAGVLGLMGLVCSRRRNRIGYGTGRTALVISLGIGLTAPAATASDGVVEINQACAIQTGCVGGDAPGFPVTLSAEGESYTLTSSLSPADPNESAIVTTVKRITIDLNGFELRGPSGCSGAGSTVSCSLSGTGMGVDGSDMTTVRNGSVVGFANSGISAGPGSVIEGIYALGNNGVGLSVGDGGRITGSTASRNAGKGIETGQQGYVEDSGANSNLLAGISVGFESVVTENRAFDNGSHGIQGDESTISRNSSNRNEGTGIDSTRSTVTENTVRANDWNGITTGGLVAHITSNNAHANATNGIWLNFTAGATIADNSSSDNGLDGISVDGESSISGNVSVANARDGIRTFGLCRIQGNNVSFNTGFGLNLSLGPASPYRENMINNNTGASVAGGLDMGDNSCNGTTSCP